MRIAISLLTLNNFADVKFTLYSLLKSDLKDHEFELFLWNNSASKDIFNDPFPDYLSSLDINFHYMPSYTNLGIVTPRIKVYEEILKQNIDDLPFDYLLELHDDMLFPDNWINELFKFDDPANAVIMPFIFGAFKMNISLDIVNEICKSYREPKVYDKLVQNHPWLVRMDALKEVGYYDNQYAPQVCEDDDLYFRLIKAGYNMVTTKRSVVFHIKSNTRAKALGLDPFNLVMFHNKHGIQLDLYKNKYLYFNSQDKALFQGEFGWIMEALPLPYSLENV